MIEYRKEMIGRRFWKCLNIRFGLKKTYLKKFPVT